MKKNLPNSISLAQPFIFPYYLPYEYLTFSVLFKSPFSGRPSLAIFVKITTPPEHSISPLPAFFPLSHLLAYNCTMYFTNLLLFVCHPPIRV